jgi:aspartate--ammonia ligase
MKETPVAFAYQPLLDVSETERGIKLIKDFFQTCLAEELNLIRVTAPLFVRAGMGINDDLNGVERPVSFAVTHLAGARLEIVQSLAKWKRLALADLGIPAGSGIYTDMNAIRPDEALDETHSLYVDQWDWERVITMEERSPAFLHSIVERVYVAMQRAEWAVSARFPRLRPILPETITFVHSQELEHRFPQLTPPQREAAVCREHGAVFVAGIGARLADGRPHDGRAPDYDDWSTPTAMGPGLNGDILFWNPELQRAFEVSSMGIRVTPESLRSQLEITGTTERSQLLFHRRLLAGELPLSIGGGIGQSRLCMFLLRKAHIGEVQAGIWPEEMIADCRRRGIPLL